MQIPRRVTRRVHTQRRWIGIIDLTHHARPAADTDKSDAQLTIEIPRRVRATRPRDARDERSF